MVGPETHRNDIIHERVEESQQREVEANQENLNESIRNEPDIAGAFNSVEQNLIAIENNNAVPAEASVVEVDQTL